MTAWEPPAGGVADFIIETVASYPPPLGTAVRVAAVTRAFTRELMRELLRTRIPEGSQDTVFDDLIRLPLVERRPIDAYALHESARGLVLADLWRSDRQFVLAVADDAASYFGERVTSIDDDWLAYVDLAYFELIRDATSALAALDDALDEPSVQTYPARRAALIGVVEELIQIGILDSSVLRWSQMWRFEEWLARDQHDRVLEIASERGIDPLTAPIDDFVSARTLVALGMALGDSGQHDAALRVLERVSAWAPGSYESTLAHFSAGELYSRMGARERAEDQFFLALEAFLAQSRLDVTVTKPWFGRLMDTLRFWRLRSRRQPHGTLRIRDPRRWALVPAPLARQDQADNEPEERLLDDDYWVFVEGQPGSGDQGTPLVEAGQGVFGNYFEAALPLAMVWGRLGQLYASDPHRLADADAAARLSGTIAEALGDVDLMSDAYDTLAITGALTKDADVQRFARQGNRDILRRAIDIGDDKLRIRAYQRLGWLELSEGRVRLAAAAFDSGIEVAKRLEDRLALAALLRGSAEAAVANGDIGSGLGLLDESIDVYDSLQASGPAAAGVLRLGDVHLQAGRFEDARSRLEEARQRFRADQDLSGEADALESLARLAATVGDYDESSRCLAEARARAATLTDSELAIEIELTAGAILEDRYRPAEAAGTYRKALALASGPLHVALRARCHERLGAAELGDGNVQAAVTEYGEAAEAYSSIGYTAERLRALASQVKALAIEQPERALTLARELVGLIPDDVDLATRTAVRLAEVDALRGAGRDAEALDLVDERGMRSIDRTQLVAAKARLLVDVGQYAAALDLVEEALAGEPNNSGFISLKGWILMHLDPPRPLEAAALYRRAHELAPDDPAAQQDLATAYHALGDAQGAREVVDQLLDRFSDQSVDVGDPWLLAQLGFSAYLGGRFDEALKYLEAAAKRNPRDFSSAFDIALVLLCRQSGDALDAYEQALGRLGGASAELQRGVLRVAIVDVEHALDWGMGADPGTARTVLARLRSADATRAAGTGSPRGNTASGGPGALTGGEA